MNYIQAINQMVMPYDRRPTVRPFGGVIQIWVIRSCDKSCFGCTQGSNLVSTPTERMTPDQFEEACISLKDYFGVVGMFGGNPALHPEFEQLCDIMAHHIPFERRGLWCNKLFGKGAIARRTFNPAVSNLNVHLDQSAYDEFKRDWPESNPFGLTQDSRHSPPYVAIKDVVKKPCPQCGIAGWVFSTDKRSRVRCPTCDGTGSVYDEDTAWDLISRCDINRYWSAMIGVFRKELRAWFCEIAGAQAMLHQHDPNYPDTGLRLSSTTGIPWWIAHRSEYVAQVLKHCQECGVPLRGRGYLSQDKAEEATEQVSKSHADIYKPKSKLRKVELVTSVQQFTDGGVRNVVDYLGNANR